MKILVTGANGFLGSRLVREYQNKYEVCGTTHETMDFTKQDQVRKVFEQFQPEVVIHCGAISDVTRCSREPERSREINVNGTKNLASACNEYHSRMIFCSSDQVYINEWRSELEPDYWVPHKEDELLKPLPLYGQQKLEAEKMCFMEQPDSIILRLTMLYDIPEKDMKLRNKGMFGENLKKNLCTHTGQAFYTGNCRGITNCQEVVANMEKVWELPRGIYNYGCTNDKNLYETIRFVFQKFGKGELVHPDENGDHRNLLMNIDKINSYGIHFETTVSGLFNYLKNTSAQ